MTSKKSKWGIIRWVEHETAHAQSMLDRIEDPTDHVWRAYWKGRLESLQFLKSETYGASDDF